MSINAMKSLLCEKIRVVYEAFLFNGVLYKNNNNLSLQRRSDLNEKNDIVVKSIYVRQSHGVTVYSVSTRHTGTEIAGN